MKTVFTGLRISNNLDGGDGGGGGTLLGGGGDPSATKTPTVAGDTPPVDAPAFDPASVFENGILRDDYVSKLGESFEKDAGILERYKGKQFPDVLKSLAENQRMARSKALSYPGEDADEQAWDAWRKGANVPESPDQVMPLEMEAFTQATGWTPEVLTPMVQSLIDKGVPGPAISHAIGQIQELAAAQNQAYLAEQQKAKTEALDALRAEYGVEMDTKLTAAQESMKRIFDKAGVPSDRSAALLNNPHFGDNPDVIRAFSSLSSMVLEAGYRGSAGAAGLLGSAMPPMEKAQAIMNSAPGFEAESKKFFAGDPAINDMVNKLIAEGQQQEARSTQVA